MPDPAISWIIIIVLIILSFFFSGAETSIACCNKFKMQVDAEAGKTIPKILLKIIDKYNRALTIILIGNNIVAIAISSISTLLFLSLFKSTGLVETTISLISSIIMTFIVYILGDTLPKTIARSIPDTFSKIVAIPIYVLMILLFPITIIFEGGVKLTSKIFRLKEEEEFTEEDLIDEIEKASEGEMIDEEQAEIVQSTMDYLDTSVEKVLTPRNAIFAINMRDLTNEYLQTIITQTNYSRIPVYDKVFDNVIGVLNVKIYFEEYSKDPHVSIRSILQKPYFVSSKVMIDDLFHGFRKHHTHIAIVRNSNNRVIGMVTMEDILEEIVSDISEPATQKRRRA
jgi:CBS domain containing-hemolysin-like protein